MLFFPIAIHLSIYLRLGQYLTKYTPKTAGKFAFNAVLDKQVLSPQPFIITVSEVVPSVTVLTKLPSEVIGFFLPFDPPAVLLSVSF